jgi:hypothetical protein
MQAGGTSAKVSWTVPEFATRYWIKYADKTIVPSLGYNPSTKKYKYDPATHTPFFAATNVPNEPNPGDVDPFVIQSVEIKGLDPAKTYTFAGRYFSKESCDDARRQTEPTTEVPTDTDAGVSTDKPSPGGCNCQQSETPWGPMVFMVCLLLFLLHRPKRTKR